MHTKQLLAMVAAAACAGSVVAADSATVSVSATVAGVCKFNAGAKTVAFSLDPSVGGAISGTVSQPTFWCTKGTGYTITDDNGANESGTTFRMKHATASPDEFMPYTFTYTNATGTGNGKSSAVTMNISASVAEADYINARAGVWNDSVVLSITP